MFGTFDVNCVASVQLPGSASNLTMTLWTMGSVDERLSKLGFEWTDATSWEKPVNFWVMKDYPKPEGEGGAASGPKNATSRIRPMPTTPMRADHDLGQRSTPGSYRRRAVMLMAPSEAWG